MGILTALSIDSSTHMPYLNTGTITDLATGSMEPGVESWVLNGGISGTTGITGRPQLFKSTDALSLFMGVLGRYLQAEGIVYDSEFSLGGIKRLLQLQDPHFPVDPNNLRFLDASEIDLAGLFRIIMDIFAYKVKNKKDLMVDTPFIDIKTNKPIQIITPTLFCIDSLSKAEVREQIDNLYAKHNIGDSGTKTVYMNDGNAKTQFMKQLPGIAARAGIYFIITAHIGDKFELNPYAPSGKDLQYMKGSDKVKGAGSQFLFLTSLLIESRSSKVLQDSNDKCKYPDTFSEATELSELRSVVVRCKNNISGTTIPKVMSQHQGILRGVTNYKFLMDHDMFGLEGSKLNQTQAWLKDTNFNRTTIRQASAQSYELYRALEVLSQMCYIRNYWAKFDITDEVDTKIGQADFVKRVIKGGSSLISDILNSRGHWTYDRSDPRKYMSIFDILTLLKKNK